MAIGTPTFVIEGGEDLRRNIRMLDENVSRKLLSRGVAVAAELIREEAAARAPKRTGSLSRHIIVRKSEVKRGRVILDIGPDKDHFYGLYLEFGVQPHEIVPDTKRALASKDTMYGVRVRHPGVTAQPWLGPSFEAKKKPAEDALIRFLRQEIREVLV